MGFQRLSVLILLAICCYGASLNVNVKSVVRVRPLHEINVAMVSPVSHLATTLSAVPPIAKAILIPSSLGFVKVSATQMPQDASFEANPKLELDNSHHTL